MKKILNLLTFLVLFIVGFSSAGAFEIKVQYLNTGPSTPPMADRNEAIGYVQSLEFNGQTYQPQVTLAQVEAMPATASFPNLPYVADAEAVITLAPNVEMSCMSGQVDGNSVVSDGGKLKFTIDTNTTYEINIMSVTVGGVKEYNYNWTATTNDYTNTRYYLIDTNGYAKFANAQEITVDSEKFSFGYDLNGSVLVIVPQEGYTVTAITANSEPIIETENEIPGIPDNACAYILPGNYGSTNELSITIEAGEKPNWLRPLIFNLPDGLKLKDIVQSVSLAGNTILVDNNETNQVMVDFAFAKNNVNILDGAAIGIVFLPQYVDVVNRITATTSGVNLNVAGTAVEGYQIQMGYMVDGSFTVLKAIPDEITVGITLASPLTFTIELTGADNIPPSAIMIQHMTASGYEQMTLNGMTNSLQVYSNQTQIYIDSNADGWEILSITANETAIEPGKPFDITDGMKIVVTMKQLNLNDKFYIVLPGSSEEEALFKTAGYATKNAQTELKTYGSNTVMFDATNGESNVYNLYGELITPSFESNSTSYEYEVWMTVGETKTYLGNALTYQIVNPAADAVYTVSVVKPSTDIFTYTFTGPLGLLIQLGSDRSGLYDGGKYTFTNLTAEKIAANNLTVSSEIETMEVTSVAYNNKTYNAEGGVVTIPSADLQSVSGSFTVSTQAVTITHDPVSFQFVAPQGSLEFSCTDQEGNPVELKVNFTPKQSVREAVKAKASVVMGTYTVSGMETNSGQTLQVIVNEGFTIEGITNGDTELSNNNGWFINVDEFASQAGSDGETSIPTFTVDAEPEVVNIIWTFQGLGTDDLNIYLTTTATGTSTYKKATFADGVYTLDVTDEDLSNRQLVIAPSNASKTRVYSAVYNGETYNQYSATSYQVRVPQAALVAKSLTVNVNSQDAYVFQFSKYQSVASAIASDGESLAVTTTYLYYFGDAESISFYPAYACTIDKITLTNANGEAVTTTATDQGNGLSVNLSDLTRLTNTYYVSVSGGTASATTLVIKSPMDILEFRYGTDKVIENEPIEATYDEFGKYYVIQNPNMSKTFYFFVKEELCMRYFPSIKAPDGNGNPMTTEARTSSGSMLTPARYMLQNGLNGLGNPTTKIFNWTVTFTQQIPNYYLFGPLGLEITSDVEGFSFTAPTSVNANTGLGQYTLKGLNPWLQENQTVTVKAGPDCSTTLSSMSTTNSITNSPNPAGITEEDGVFTIDIDQYPNNSGTSTATDYFTLVLDEVYVSFTGGLANMTVSYGEDTVLTFTSASLSNQKISLSEVAKGEYVTISMPEGATKVIGRLYCSTYTPNPTWLGSGDYMKLQIPSEEFINFFKTYSPKSTTTATSFAIGTIDSRFFVIDNPANVTVTVTAGLKVEDAENPAKFNWILVNPATGTSVTGNMVMTPAENCTIEKVTNSSGTEVTATSNSNGVLTFASTKFSAGQTFNIATSRNDALEFEDFEMTFTKNSPNVVTYGVPVSLTAGEVVPYLGFQFDITLPAGFYLEDATESSSAIALNAALPGSVSYGLYTNDKEDVAPNTYRVIANLTNNNTGYTQTSDIATITVSAKYADTMEDGQTLPVVIQNTVIFSDVLGSEVMEIAGCEGQVTIHLNDNPATAVSIESVTVKEPSYSSNEMVSEVTCGETVQVELALEPEDATTTDITWVIEPDDSGVSVSFNESTGLWEFDTTDMDVAEGTDVTITIKATVDDTTVESEPYTIKVKGLLLGDSNGNGKVNVADVVTTANIIAEKPVKEFVFPNADVILSDEPENTVQDIDIADVTATIEIALNTWDGERTPKQSVRRHARRMESNDFIFADNFLAREGRETSISFDLDNSYAYVGLQATVIIPEGMTVNGVTAGPRAAGHEMVYNVVDNRLKVVFYSTKNDAFRETSGALFTINVTASEDCRNLEMENILASDASCNTYGLQFAGGLNETETTGIEGIDSDAEGVRYFTVDGIEVRNPEKGMLLIRVENGKAEKVIVK